MQIRLGAAADALQITEVERTVALPPWSLAQILSSCHNKQQSVWVLETDTGEIAGFAISELAAGEASLLNIAILPRYQGRQQGEALLQAVLENARVAGACRCLLEVRCSNGAAISLYRKYGFVKDGLRKNYYPTEGGREDAVLMSLDMGGTE